MNNMQINELIELLNLKEHPREGGYFVETYRSTHIVGASTVTPGIDGDRSLSTAIYFLLTPTAFSEMHRLPYDEIFHFYRGDAVEMVQLSPHGTGRVIRLGNDIRGSEQPQVIVPAGVWQGSRLKTGGRFALLGTTMAPGFDLDDYQSGVREDLIRQYPDYADKIDVLTNR